MAVVPSRVDYHDPRRRQGHRQPIDGRILSLSVLIPSKDGISLVPASGFDEERAFSALISTGQDLQSFPPVVLSYSEQEYTNLLQDADSAMPWSREETDYVFELLRRYEGRFVVVADRYSFKGNTRSIEDIKERYYDVCARLHAARGQPDSGPRYSKEKDLKRRAALDVLFGRDQATIQEEASAINALKKAQRDFHGTSTLRDSMIILLGGGQATVGLPTFPELIGKPATAKKAHPPTGEAADNKAASLEKPSKKRSHQKASARASNPKRRRESVSTIASTEYVPPLTPGRKPKPTTAATYLRSTRLRPVRIGLSRHVDRVLADLGFGPRPQWPTDRVCERFDELRMLIVQVTDLKKVVDKLSGLPDNPSRRY